MKYNPFNLKTLKPLDIQTFEREVTPNPKPMHESTPEPVPGGNAEGLIDIWIGSYVNDNDEVRIVYNHLLILE